MKSDSSISKYLSRYAEASAGWATRLPPVEYQSAAVVPAFAEKADFVEELLGEPRGDKARLLIVVVNEAPGAGVRERELNQQLISHIEERASFSQRIQDSPASFHRLRGRRNLDVAVIDATRVGYRLKVKEGVGRARKMGCDFALALYHEGRLKSHFLGSTDADVVLPPSYFETLEEESAQALGAGLSLSALLFPYEHLEATGGQYGSTMMEVEASFRYYVLGLASAGSPYAYHSLGSSLAVSLPFYAQVRGFPNRQAGEDFYLLAKLSKLAPLRRLKAPRIRIETRLSSRVPFGTGPALARAVEERLEGHSSSTYNPRSFESLKVILKVLEVSVLAQRPRLGLNLAERQLELWEAESLEKVWRQLAPHLGQCPSAEHRRRRLHESFDALSTLRYIHEAHRSGGLRHIPLKEAVAESFRIPVTASKQERLKLLRRREEDLPTLVGPTVDQGP